VLNSPGARAALLAVLLGIVVVLGVGVILLEQPSRADRFSRTRRWSIAILGISIVAILGAVLVQGEPSSVTTSGTAPSKNVPLATVLREVKASNKIRTVPSNLVPSVSEAVQGGLSNIGFPPLSTGCFASELQDTVPACVFGDRNGTHTLVLYGDSHAAMWFQAIEDIATRAHWRLIILSKAACPAAPLPTHYPTALGNWPACNQWHRYAINRINRLDPDLVIITQSMSQTPEGVDYTPAQWQQGLEQLLQRVHAPATQKLVLGDIPPARGPNCLALYVDDVQGCSEHPVPSYNNAERLAAAAKRARYVNVTPWFCATKCSAIIGVFDVYYDPSHVAVGYSRFLEGVLAQKLDLPQLGR
jgi:hypothetical protein